MEYSLVAPSLQAEILAAGERIAELEAALIEMLAPDDVTTDMPGGVMVRHRHSAKKWELVRRELPLDGVEFTLKRREQTT